MQKKEHLIIALNSTLEKSLKTETNLNTVNYSNFNTLYQATKISLQQLQPEKNKKEYNRLVSSLPQLNHKKWNWIYDSPRSLTISLLISLPFIITLLTTASSLTSLIVGGSYIILTSILVYSFYKTHLIKKMIIKDLAVIKHTVNDIIFCLKQPDKFKIEMEKLEVKKKMLLS